MRCPVYRNLDKPFQILGFNALELAALCIVFVGGGELAQMLSLQRIWAFLFAVVLGVSFAWTRHSLGECFGRRLYRFLMLPRKMHPKGIILRNRH